MRLTNNAFTDRGLTGSILGRKIGQMDYGLLEGRGWGANILISPQFGSEVILLMLQSYPRGGWKVRECEMGWMKVSYCLSKHIKGCFKGKKNFRHKFFPLDH